LGGFIDRKQAIFDSKEIYDIKESPGRFIIKHPISKMSVQRLK
jgi:hypothetical protein